MGTLVTLRPTGAGSGAGNAQHSKNTGAANWTHCDEVVSDGSGTYVYNNNIDTSFLILIDRYGLEDLTYYGKINSVTVFIRTWASLMSAGGTFSSKTLIRTSGVNWFGAENINSGAEQEFSTVYANHPAGGAWTRALVNALEAGTQTTVAGDGVNSSEVDCTQVWVVVDVDLAFVPSGAGTATLNAPQPSFILGAAPVAQAAPFVGTSNLADPLSLSSNAGVLSIASVVPTNPYAATSNAGTFSLDTEAADFLREMNL